jgi:hypothetical protein
MTADKKAKDVAFSMRVIPSAASLIPIVLVAPSIALVVLPFMSDLAAFVTGLLATLVILGLVLMNAPVVTVAAGLEPTLKVGRAEIALRFIDTIEIVTGDQVRFEKGPGLNAKAYFVNQAGAKVFVKVAIKDESDPTPYWLFACSKPDALVVALRANR